MLIDYVQAAEQGIIQAMREGHATGKVEGRTLFAQEVCRSLGIDHSTPPMAILGEIARLKAAAPCTLDVVRQAVREEMEAAMVAARQPRVVTMSVLCEATPERRQAIEDAVHRSVCGDPPASPMPIRQAVAAARAQSVPTDVEAINRALVEGSLMIGQSGVVLMSGGGAGGGCGTITGGNGRPAPWHQHACTTCGKLWIAAGAGPHRCINEQCPGTSRTLADSLRSLTLALGERA
jgi:hypothetical protein